MKNLVSPPYAWGVQRQLLNTSNSLNGCAEYAYVPQLENENQCVVPNHHLSRQIHRQLPQLQEFNLYEIFAIVGELLSTKSMRKLETNLNAHLFQW